MRRHGQQVKKQTVEKSDPVADRFMKMLAMAKEPDVEIEPTKITKKPVPLQIQAKPILANIGTVATHKKKIMSWEIEEPKESADSLIETAMVSLGFKKPKPKPPAPVQPGCIPLQAPCAPLQLVNELRQRTRWDSPQRLPVIAANARAFAG